MRKLLPIVALGMLVSCAKQKEELIPIDQFFSEYNEAYLKQNPLVATFRGDHRFNDQLDNWYSDAYKKKAIAFDSLYLVKAQAYQQADLSGEDALNLKLLIWELEESLENWKSEFRGDLIPLDQLWSVHIIYGYLASGQTVQPFENTQHYDDWLARMDVFAEMIDTVIVKMEQGIELGYVRPRSIMEKVIPQIENFTTLPVEENVVYTPIKNFPDSVSTEDQERLMAAYKVTGERMIKKFQTLLDFTRDVYLPASRETSGIGELPKGKEEYQRLIRSHTTTDMTADEIFEIGQSEVKRIRLEMEQVKKQVGFEGDLSSFFEYVKNKKELKPYTDPQQVLDSFEAIHERMKPHLKKLFNVNPKTAFEIRRVEAFREKSVSMSYQPGTPDGSRPGVFYVPIPDVRNYNIMSDENGFLHEAIPGHHFQLSLQIENDGVPEFRKYVNYNAYTEGWGLYAETLGKELGLYQDEYQYLGALTWDMHRALRLVLDVGIHAKGWSREDAINFAMENEPLEESEIISEVERYMSIPGQALSYKIGQLKILELRKRAEDQLGDRFDIIDFHNTVLESGTIPLSVLEERIDQWIEENR